MYQNILVAVDGSDENKHAVDDAVKLAKAVGAKLTAIYVVTGAELSPNAFGGDVSDSERKAIADKNAKAAIDYVEFEASREGVPLEVKILNGKPCDVIVEESKNFDLIVCGSLGRTGLAKALIGSVSSKIVKYAHCPVLLSRKK
ncbi:MAG: universal stress protein [Candidatus Methanomethylophilaceae archaeon]|nr:universal stress protein [Candidatus Methanomethylophilaceae archaeon]